LFGQAGASNIDLGTLGGANSFATAINNNGQIVGSAATGFGPNPGNRAVLFDLMGGPNVNLGTLGGTFSGALGINDNGQIVGYSALAGSFPLIIHATLFGTAGGSNVDLGTLGGSFSSAQDINENGQIVGRSFTTGNVARHAVLFDTSGGPNVDLGTLGGDSSDALAINNRSEVIGLSEDANGRYGAFYWTHATGMLPLLSLIDPSLGWVSFFPAGIDESGRIAVNGWNSITGLQRALILTPIQEGPISDVPEPGSLFLVGTALTLLLACGRRRIQLVPTV